MGTDNYLIFISTICLELDTTSSCRESDIVVRRVSSKDFKIRTGNFTSSFCSTQNICINTGHSFEELFKINSTRRLAEVRISSNSNSTRTSSQGNSSCASSITNSYGVSYGASSYGDSLCICVGTNINSGA